MESQSVGEGIVNANAEDQIDGLSRHVEGAPRSVTPRAAPLAAARTGERRSDEAANAPREAALSAPEWTAQLAPLSIWREGERYLVCIDLPGVPRDRIRVTLFADRVEVTAERADPRGHGARLVWGEPSSTHFRRVIPLPAGTAGADVRAEARDGTIELSVPAAPRRRALPVR